MTIASEITRIQGNIADAYTACNGKGATMPVTQNSANLVDCIDSIQTGGTIDALTVTPATSQQTITASGGTDGYSPVTVSAVTSSIDANITAGNIKKDVTILGVTGTYEGSGGIGITREVSQSGVYGFPSANFTFSLPSNATDLGPSALERAFYSCTTLTSVDLSALTTVSGSKGMYYAFSHRTGLTSVDLSALTTVSGSSGMDHAFDGCTGLTSVDLSALTTVSGSSGMSHAFDGCTGLTSVDLSALTTVSGSSGMIAAFGICTGLTSVDLSALTTVSGINGMASAFDGCTGLTSVDLSALTTVSGVNGMYAAFNGCTGLTSVDLSALTTVSGSGGMYSAFKNCYSLRTLSFPALTTSSFGSNTNQFNVMLQGVTGCTVHFPSNLQSVIGSWSSVTSGFGGTSTTVLFDLPATS